MLILMGRLINWDRKIPQWIRQSLINGNSCSGGGLGRYVYRQQQQQQSQRHHNSSSMLWKMDNWQQQGIFNNVKGIRTYPLKNNNLPITYRIQNGGGQCFGGQASLIR